MKNIFKKSVLLLIPALFFTVITFAQFPVDPCTDPLLECPIDNGVLFLIAVAMFIAIKKIVDAKRNMVV